MNHLKGLDITDAALGCGLAVKVLKHYNKVTPWGARKRTIYDYLYVLRVNSKGTCDIWIRERKNEEQNVMYMSFNEKVGALTSTELDQTHISLLNEAEIACIQQSRLQILESRLRSTSS